MTFLGGLGKYSFLVLGGKCIQIPLILKFLGAMKLFPRVVFISTWLSMPGSLQCRFSFKMLPKTPRSTAALVYLL